MLKRCVQVIMCGQSLTMFLLVCQLLLVHGMHHTPFSHESFSPRDMLHNIIRIVIWLCLARRCDPMQASVGTRNGRAEDVFEITQVGRNCSWMTNHSTNAWMLSYCASSGFFVSLTHELHWYSSAVTTFAQMGAPRLALKKKAIALLDNFTPLCAMQFGKKVENQEIMNHLKSTLNLLRSDAASRSKRPHVGTSAKQPKSQLYSFLGGLHCLLRTLLFDLPTSGGTIHCGQWARCLRRSYLFWSLDEVGPHLGTQCPLQCRIATLLESFLTDPRCACRYIWQEWCPQHWTINCEACWIHPG